MPPIIRFVGVGTIQLMRRQESFPDNQAAGMGSSRSNIPYFKNLPNEKKRIRLAGMKLGVIANINRPDARSVVERVIKWCRENKQEFYLPDYLGVISDLEMPLIPREELPKRCNYILAMGGDGTLLATSRLVGATEVPILGINIGSLGFLTEQTPHDLELSLIRIKNGNFKL